MNSLLGLALLLTSLALVSCSIDDNPLSTNPIDGGVRIGSPLLRIVLEADGSYTHDVTVPANTCGIPAGLFTVNMTGVVSEIQSWSASNAMYSVTKSVVTTTNKKNRFGWGNNFSKIVTTWTVTEIASGETVSWVETSTFGDLGEVKTTIGRVRCG